MNHWLLKSEPDSFSIDALGRAPKQTTTWDGVRNFQARNMLRDSMKKGDLAFFYHSSCEVPGIAGIASIAKEGYPDKTAQASSLRCRFLGGCTSLVRGGREVGPQVRSDHHAR
jgi:predicted RNA-binding protein with PUA-like domain